MLKTRLSPVNQSFLQMNICVLLLGGTALFAKLVSLPADVITFYRAIIGFISLYSIMILTRSSSLSPSRYDVFPIMITGLFTGGHWVFYFHAIQISTVAVGILSLYTFPLITAILEPLIDRETVSIGKIVPAAIVFIGIFLLIPEWEISNQTAVGLLYGIVSSVLFSLRNVAVRKKLGHLSSITIMCYQLAIVSIMMIPFISFKESLMINNRLPLLVLLGFLFTAVPHVLLVASLRHVKAATASLVLCLHPVYSIVFAAILLSEIPPSRVLWGGFLIFGVSLYESIRIWLNK